MRPHPPAAGKPKRPVDPHRWGRRLLCACTLVALAGLPSCRCKGGKQEPGPASSPGPITLRPSRMVPEGGAVFIAVRTAAGIKQLRIGSDGKTQVYGEEKEELTSLAASVPARPEICRVVNRHADPPGSGPTRSVVQRVDLTARGGLPPELDLGPGNPSAIAVIADKCIVAFAGKVDAFDFRTQPPVRTTIHAYDKPDPKPIDTFARDGSLVVGVDDFVEPKFAFVYDVDAAATLRPRYAGSLGSLTNGVYGEAVLADRWLVAMSAERFRGGESQGIQLFHVGDTELTPQGRADESKSDDEKVKPELIAGTEMTPWRAVGVAGDRILLCASKRGILALPPNLPRGAKAQVIDTGLCRDMLVVDDYLYVLRSNGLHEPGRIEVMVMSGGALQRRFQQDLGVWAREIIRPSSRRRTSEDE